MKTGNDTYGLEKALIFCSITNYLYNVSSLYYQKPDLLLTMLLISEKHKPVTVIGIFHKKQSTNRLGPEHKKKQCQNFTFVDCHYFYYFLLFILIFELCIYVCTFACVYAHTGTQKRMLDTLELEIQEAISVKQMLGTELWSSTRAVHTEQKSFNLILMLKFYSFRFYTFYSLIQ